MPSTRETVLAALFSRLLAMSGPLVLRNEALPVRIPAGGVLILRDGDPGEPEVTLSPLRYFYSHRAEIDVLVQADAGRDTAFDALTASVGAVIAADRTLGGLCDWIEIQAPETVEIAAEGTEPVKAAVLPVLIDYAAASPV
ncbi:acyl-CoA transferase [Rhodobacter sp. KR11]|uniref:acyl-CoA transferase n=1 Tax=Rhodobacter sp. KR11 TaxID=2974588 RepID=UPI002221E4BA|nr:acyl-CoA transferase [Rhodobacter sp. KR11]MCW1920819.1 acyl-CoA transferase [Rhodobacter sp. KR11]